MNTKNDVEVIINGKQYTISGYESSEYLQRIATHINDKYAEFRQDEGYNRLDADMKNILLAINLSDEYYKVQESIQDLQREKEDLEKEIFNMKHDMIAMKSRLEDQEKKLGELKKDKKHSEHEVIRLETELKNAKEDNETLISIQSMAGVGVADSSTGENVPLPDNSDAKEDIQLSGNNEAKENVPLSDNSEAEAGTLSSDSSDAEEPVPPEDSDSVVGNSQQMNHETLKETENGEAEEILSKESEAGSSIAAEEESDASESVHEAESRNTVTRNTKNSSKRSRKKRRR